MARPQPINPELDEQLAAAVYPEPLPAGTFTNSIRGPLHAYTLALLDDMERETEWIYFGVERPPAFLLDMLELRGF